MRRKGLLMIWLCVVVLLLGARVAIAETDIPEPRIERIPKIFLYRAQIPPYFPVISPGGTPLFASFDLTDIDLTEYEDLLKEAMFNSKTIWPTVMPESFDPDQVLEWGKNPGIGLRNLHSAGITGKGVGIAVLDQSIFLQHEQWIDRVKMYEEINYDSPWTGFHGTGVLSTAAGNTTGVAPGTDIYFISYVNQMDNNYHVQSMNPLVQAIRRIIEVNKILPIDRKIRVISISSGWIPNDPDYEDVLQIIQEAGDAGIFVVSGNLFETHGMYFYGLDIDLMADRDDLSSYKVLPWSYWVKKVSHTPGFPEFYEENFEQDVDENYEILLTPCDRMTVAASDDVNGYVFYKNNGWSHVIPYIAGLYALACQADPNITPEIFWAEALNTGEKRMIEKDGNYYVGKIVNPAKLVESLKKN